MVICGRIRRSAHGMRSRPRLAAIALVVLGGCGSDSPREGAIEAADETAVSGGTAVLAENGDMRLPMPLFASTVIDGDMHDIMYMSLYRAAWENGRTVQRLADESPMAIARRYEYIGDDSTALRFHLRTGLRWSDGEPITAHDVVWTYRTMMDPQLASPRGDYVEHMDSVVAQNDSTVTFHFSRRYPEMVFHAGHGIAPRHAYLDHPVADLEFHPDHLDPAGNLVVSGPFQLSGWDREQQIVFTPNPHFRPRPHLDRLVVRIIPDETTRLVELQRGAIDGMRISSPANIAPLQQAPEVRLERIGRRFNEFVAYNPEIEPFGDPEIRRALGLAVDVPTLIAALELSTYADPAASAYSPIFVDLRDPELAPLSYDPDRARAILDEKGWVDADGDGVRERGGRPFAFTLALNSGNQRRSDLGTMLQRYWSDIGVQARPQQQEFQTLNERLREKDFEAAIYGWQASLSPDISGMWRPDAPYNFVSYDSPELQAAMDSALAQPTEADAVRHWKAAARLIARDQPYTWLYYMDQVVALRSRLRDVDVDTFGLYQNVWEWWIESAQQEGGGSR